MDGWTEAETPTETKAVIRQERISSIADPSLPCANDSLRRAAFGEDIYANVVRREDAPNESHDLTPVWIMRQAGRYLPEFQRIRSRHSFMTICKDPLLAAEVTLQPYRRFPLLDAVIIFSDILVIPEAMGMPLAFKDNSGPEFAWNIKTPADIARLSYPDIEKVLGYVFDAIYVVSRQIDNKIPIIGFSGAPLSLLCYMVGSGSARTGRECKEFLFKYPAAAHELLSRMNGIIEQYLVKQIESGARVLQVFDTSAGLFAPQTYNEFGAKYMIELANRVKTRHPAVPLIGFAKDRSLPAFVSSSFDVISTSWADEIETVKRRFQRCGVGETCSGSENVKALQGNLDPHILYASPEVITKETKGMVEAFQPGRYIANLGHGMEPQMNPDHVGVFINAVKEASSRILASRTGSSIN